MLDCVYFGEVPEGYNLQPADDDPVSWVREGGYLRQQRG